MATKRPENGTTEERSRESAWRFGETRHGSTSPMAQIEVAKVGAPPWYPCSSQWSPEKGGSVSYSERERVSG